MDEFMANVSSGPARPGDKEQLGARIAPSPYSYLFIYLFIPV